MKRKAIWFILLAIILCVVVGILLLPQIRRFCVMRMGYFSVAEVVALDGYAPTEDANTYTKTVAGKTITLTFNTAAETCNKNEYIFSFQDAWRNTNGELYLEEAILESILKKDVLLENHFSILLEDMSFTWLDQPRLVAHAGGSFRCATENGYYTNSLEALIQNYSLGHRVFEFDFVPTSDDNLALVHD